MKDRGWRGAPYPGDTLAKRTARTLLYRRAVRLWQAVGVNKIQGLVVTLAGLDAPEVGAIRYFLRHPPEKTLFVDTDKRALDAVQEQWPQARTWHGPVKEVLEASKENEISFLNLDFMGNFTEEVSDTFKAAAKKVEPGGIVSYTFKRGRESRFTPRWTEIVDRVNQALDATPSVAASLPKYMSRERMDAFRFLGYLGLIRERLGSHFDPIFAVRYHTRREGHAGSPMGVLAVQNTSNVKDKASWLRVASSFTCEEERRQEIPVRHNIEDVHVFREIALDLSGTMSSREISEFLRIPIGTIAAWLAHQTRGTYG